MSARDRHHINLFWSEEDVGYIADNPDLAACPAFGESLADALREVLIAQKAWIASAKKIGKKVLEPRYRPAIYQAAAV